ncbi:MAG: hypothetical protein JXR53_04480 [Bacteroidales bacterium]|jgi:hypothetical protein|nr:hypothetical protein [Bacteroidales bacterium]
MKTNPKVYYEEAYPPVPLGFVRFMRKFFLWQLFRFFVLNYKVMRIVAYGHS